MPPRRSVTTSHGVRVELAPLADADHDDLFAAFARLVADGDGWPEAAPLAREQFETTWLHVPREVTVARVDGRFAGAYLVKPNFVGRAAHIANAGYFVVREQRGRGIGRVVVADSIERARTLGFDAIQFNLVFASNPARALYEELGWQQVGRIPEAVDGEDAVVYWRSLADVRTGAGPGPRPDGAA